MLMEKEKILREKLSAAEDPGARKDLNKNLQEVLVKQQEIYVLLEKGGGAPGLPSRAEFKKLQQSELEIRELLSQTNDQEKQAELKMKLEQVMVKQTEIKSMLKADSANAEATIEDLEKQYQMLDQKAADVRAKLAETQDAQQKAELEDLLKKIAMKQEQIKIEAEKIKAAQEKKRN
jgi:hypothetical protein